MLQIFDDVLQAVVLADFPHYSHNAQEVHVPPQAGPAGQLSSADYMLAVKDDIFCAQGMHGHSFLFESVCCR